MPVYLFKRQEYIEEMPNLGNAGFHFKFKHASKDFLEEEELEELVREEIREGNQESGDWQVVISAGFGKGFDTVHAFSVGDFGCEW